MSRVLIIGDSLSMPRPDDGIEYEDTYPYLLQNAGFEVICRGRRANDTKIQNERQNLLDDLIFFWPEVVVLHLGIVSCK